MLDLVVVVTELFFTYIHDEITIKFPFENQKFVLPQDTSKQVVQEYQEFENLIDYVISSSIFKNVTTIKIQYPLMYYLKNLLISK